MTDMRSGGSLVLGRGDVGSGAVDALLYVRADVDVTGGALLTVRGAGERVVLRASGGDASELIPNSVKAALGGLQLTVVHAPWADVGAWPREAGDGLQLIVSSVGWRGAPDDDRDAAWFDGPLALMRGRHVVAFVPAGGPAELVVPVSTRHDTASATHAAHDVTHDHADLTHQCLCASVASYLSPWTRSTTGLDVIVAAKDLQGDTAHTTHCALGLVALRATHPELQVRLIVPVKRGALPRAWRSLGSTLGMMPVEAGARLLSNRVDLAQLAAVVGCTLRDPPSLPSALAAFQARGGGLIPRALLE